MLLPLPIGQFMQIHGSKLMFAEAISQALNSEREHQEKRIEEETIGEDREY